MKTLRIAVSFLAALTILACLCTCAFADGGAADVADGIWTYVEYIAGGVCAFIFMRWITGKLRSDKNGKADKDNK